MQRLLHWFPRMILLAAIAFTLCNIFFLLHVSEKTFVLSSIPKQYNGYKIAHINNLENSPGQAVSKARGEKPDAIVITGNLSNSNGKYNSSVSALNKLAKIAPTYYVLGPNDSIDIVNQVNGAEYIGGKSTALTIDDSIDAMKYIEETYGKKMIKLINEGDERALAYKAYTEEKLAKDAALKVNLVGITNYSTAEEVDAELMNIYKEGVGNINIGLAGSTNFYETIKDYDMNLLLSGITDGSSYCDEKEYVMEGTTLLVSNGVHGKEPNNIHLITLSDGSVSEKNILEKFLGLFISDVDTIFENDGGFKEHTYEFKDEGHKHF